MSAHFEVCSCGKHGRIILANGFVGGEVVFRQAALRLVRVGIGHKLMNDEEAASVSHEIVTSSLPDMPDEADLMMLFLCGALNEWRSSGGPLLDKEARHKFLHEKIPPADIPTDFLSGVMEHTSANRPS